MTSQPDQPPDTHLELSAVQKRIAGATGIMMAAILSSRILGLIRDSVVAARLGQRFEADVYNAAFMLPDLLFFLIAGGGLGAAFIPVFTEYLSSDREQDAWKIFSTVATIMALAVGVLIAVGWIFAGPLIHITNFGYPPDKVAATVPLTRIVLPAQICFFLCGLLMGTLNVRQQFLIPAVGPIIYNMGIIIGGLLLGSKLGPAGFCWGALSGALIGNFLLQLWAVRRIGMQFSPSFDLHHPGVIKVWKLMLPVLLGLALPQVSIIINRMFASELGNGPQSALINANRLIQFPLGVFAQAMAVAIFPTLSLQAAAGQINDLRRTTSLGIRSILFLTVPTSIWMTILATPIVQLILQQVHFTAADTPLTVIAMEYYAIGIFAWSVQAILARGFYAMQDSLTPVVIGTVATIVFIPLNWIFMKPLHMGHGGLALATSIGAILNMAALFWVLRRRLYGIEGGRMLIAAVKIAVASGVSALVCLASRNLLMGHLVGLSESSLQGLKIESLATILISSALALVAYLATARFLRMEEMQAAIGAMRRQRMSGLDD